MIKSKYLPEYEYVCTIWGYNIFKKIFHNTQIVVYNIEAVATWQITAQQKQSVFNYLKSEGFIEQHESFVIQVI